MEPPADQDSDDREADRFDRLSDRHRRYLRYAMDNLKSKEIARLEGVSSRSVDRQLADAAKILGVDDRFKAARELKAFENEGRKIPLQTSSLDDGNGELLPLPTPTRRMPVNLLKAREILIWGAIVMIATTIGLAVAAMLIHSLMILFGVPLT